MRTRLLLVFVVAIVTAGALAQSRTAERTRTAKQGATSTKDSGEAGEQLFRQNCARCHQPPDNLSQNEVRAVLQHMRVRANLRAQDEQALLKYLAPGR